MYHREGELPLISSRRRGGHHLAFCTVLAPTPGCHSKSRPPRQAGAYRGFLLRGHLWSAELAFGAHPSQPSHDALSDYAAFKLSKHRCHLQ